MPLASADKRNSSCGRCGKAQKKTGQKQKTTMPRKSANKKVKISAKQLRTIRKNAAAKKPPTMPTSTRTHMPTRQQITIQVPKGTDTRALQKRIAELVASGEFKQDGGSTATPTARKSQGSLFQRSSTAAPVQQQAPAPPTSQQRMQPMTAPKASGGLKPFTRSGGMSMSLY